ncbi:MAG: N-acetyltransferase [Cyanobacteria bacterium J06627_28]
MTIRTATHSDREAIHHVHWSAFEEDERDIVSKLAVDLLLAETFPKTISLVAELDESVVGHVAFSPVGIENDETFRGYILAPLGVMPDYQKRRIGTELVEAGIQQVSGMETDILLVYGDPKYYGRFGFSAAVAEQYLPPYQLKYPYGWQAIALKGDARKTPANFIFVSALNNSALW